MLAGFSLLLLEEEDAFWALVTTVEDIMTFEYYSGQLKEARLDIAVLAGAFMHATYGPVKKQAVVTLLLSAHLLTFPFFRSSTCLLCVSTDLLEHYMPDLHRHLQEIHVDIKSFYWCVPPFTPKTRGCGGGGREGGREGGRGVE